MNARRLFAASLALAIVATQLCAQDDVKETKVVLRVSRSFLRTLLGVRVHKLQPIDDSVAGATIVGNANVAGKLDVRLHKSDTHSDFDLTFAGAIDTEMAATRRPVQIFAHGAAPFQAQRRIVLKDRTFSAEPLCMSVSHRFELDDIDTIRRGPLSPLVRGLARPIVRRSLADGDRQAEQQIRQEIGVRLEVETDKLVEVLNHIDPAYRKVMELVHTHLGVEHVNLQLYRAASDEHIILSVGRQGMKLPMLPDLGKNSGAPLELWVSTDIKANDPRVDKLLEHWRNIEEWKALKAAVRAQLLRRHPKLADVREKVNAVLEIHPLAVENTPWRVVTFAPKLHLELPVLELP
jgi:hypothetical protein